jgi:hypothetical protein
VSSSTMCSFCKIVAEKPKMERRESQGGGARSHERRGENKLRELIIDEPIWCTLYDITFPLRSPLSCIEGRRSSGEDGHARVSGSWRGRGRPREKRGSWESEGGNRTVLRVAQTQSLHYCRSIAICRACEACRYSDLIDLTGAERDDVLRFVLDGCSTDKRDRGESKDRQ